MGVDVDNLRSLLGIAAIVGLGVLFSENRRAIRWRVVGSGLALQAVFAIIVLKTEPGIRFFQWLGAGVLRLTDFTRDGSSFVFGSLARPDGPAGFVFAFHVLPTVIFIGALMSVLYHLGIMQRVVQGMSWVMARIMGVSGAESLASAVNVFVGQTEAPLVIKPYLAHMTRSELMAVMVGGFANIAGGVLVAYVAMGISGAHLLAASIMSAPASLLVAKLLVPETETPETAGQGYVPVEKLSVNVLDAAATGATDGVKLAINVGGMLIAFLALVALLNYLLGAFGGLFGVDVTIAKILGYVFSPLAFAIGVPRQDCVMYGELVGTQISLNEFVAYLRLRELLPTTTFEGAAFSPRAAMLATYSLCSFANLGSIGIQLGGIGSLVESRRHDLARLGLKAMLAGVLTTNLTASIAGVLVTNAEAEYRHAYAEAQRQVAAGDLDRADDLLLETVNRNPGSGWDAKAREKVERLGSWRNEVSSQKRTLADVQKERL